ncbi:ANTAR domain-containing protein [Streptomyces massasporeus]|uniref:ANTAR domain-containing protein n=1 Tax=Streptomyces massasporeus TaxID=67324 RepID=UPI00369A5127
MTSSALPDDPTSTQVPVDDLLRDLARLQAENRQLQHAVASHAAIDQAIGVLVVLGQVSPVDGFAVLREVSQNTNTKLSSIAEHMHAQGVALPDPVLAELRAALARHT